MTEPSPDPTTRATRADRTAAEVLAWVVVLVAVWAATLTTVGLLELGVAAVAALPLAVLAVAARRVLDAPARLPAGWWRWAVRLPGAVVADTARLAVAVIGAGRSGTPVGAERRLRLAAHADDGGPDGRVTIGAATISATPGSYVADVRDDGLVVHALAPSPSALERAVAR